MAGESAHLSKPPRRHAGERRKPPRRHARGHGLGKRVVGRVLVVSAGFAVIGALATVPQVSTWVGDRLLESSTATVTVTDSCDAVNVTQPHGVGRPGARDRVVKGERRVADFTPNRRIYRQHVALDADRDGIACEHH